MPPPPEEPTVILATPLPPLELAVTVTVPAVDEAVKVTLPLPPVVVADAADNVPYAELLRVKLTVVPSATDTPPELTDAETVDVAPVAKLFGVAVTVTVVVGLPPLPPLPPPHAVISRLARMVKKTSFRRRVVMASP